MAWTTSGIPSVIWLTTWLFLKFIIAGALDEITPLPKCKARFSEGVGLQAELGFDHGALSQIPVRQVPADDAPHVIDVA